VRGNLWDLSRQKKLIIVFCFVTVFLLKWEALRNLEDSLGRKINEKINIKRAEITGQVIILSSPKKSRNGGV